MQKGNLTVSAPEERPTILIVDDQPVNIELLAKILKDNGYNTRPTLNGQVALGAVVHTPPDLILLDIRMPGLDGFELCKKLKADQATRHIPVIFISALDDIDEKIKAFQAGGVDYISRPYQVPEVLARVATHLELARMRSHMESLIRERTTALESETRKLHQEIVTHQATAKQLLQSKERYRFLVENQNDLIVKTDAQNRLIFASDLVYRTFDKSEEALMDQQILQLIEEKNRKTAERALADLATPPHQVTFQGRTMTKDGWRWFEWSAKARLNANGDIIDTVSVGRDITEAKEATAALINSEENFRQIAENIREVFWISSPDWNEIYYISPAYEQIWGRSCQSLYQAPRSWLDVIPNADRDKILNTIPSPIDDKTKQIDFPKYRVNRPDGTMRWIKARAFPVRNSQGEVYRVAGIAEDITEKIEMESQLRQHYKMEAIGTLAGGIAHEFNNVLGIIIGNTELMLDDTPVGSINQQYLQEVFKASLRGRDVVKQLLNFSRKSSIERIPIDLGHNVKEALQLIKASLPATIHIEVDMDTKIQTVVANATQISQLMVNLCNNASQAMQEKGGTLHISLKNTVIDNAKADKLGVQSGGYVLLSVSDSGHGIKPNIIDRVFDPYFTTRKIGKGTGMGLAIVHGIVGSHQGAIAVQSTMGQGACFDVYLPASKRLSTPARRQTPAAPTGNETILFVDDEASITRVGKALLSRLGYTVCVETDPAKALHRFQTEPDAFDLVITDMTMPHITGDQLAAKLLNVRRETPIIICTGHNDQIDKEKSQAIGIRRYIEKPFEKHKIATAIRQVLDDSGDGLQSIGESTKANHRQNNVSHRADNIDAAP